MDVARRKWMVGSVGCVAIAAIVLWGVSNAAGETSNDSTPEVEITEWGDGPPMEEFSSTDELKAAMTEILERRETRRKKQQEQAEDLAALQEEAPAGADSMAMGGESLSPEQDNEAITNVQEQGVDEGGIVKNIGDHLVVLRRKRLFTVDVAESGETTEVDSLRVAPSEELNDNVWYDEVLVRGDRIYVIGYRYRIWVDNSISRGGFSGATEVTSFTMDRSGNLKRGESTFFESNDYFSTNNYTGRLVDGQLIFYLPYHNLEASLDEPIPEFPRFLEHERENRFTTKEPLFEATDVVRPIDLPERPSFHTVVQCELPDDMGLDCEATSLMSDRGREFYVSPTRVYLWSGDHVLAISQTEGTVEAHTVLGTPIDQFSFAERDDTLYVAVSLAGLKLLELPLSEFNSDGDQSVGKRVVEVSDRIRGRRHTVNRHVGDWYLAGSAGNLVAHHRDSGQSRHVGVDGRTSRVARIEAAPGVGAVIGYEGRGRNSSLVLDTLLLDDRRADIVKGVEMPSTSIGESRSHGFFFRPDEKGGVLGLPVIGSDGGWWGRSASNIAFFRTEESGAIEFRGTVSSSDEADDSCETSCIDWYGNTRPVFLRDRIYALMGSEIVEVSLGDDDVDELGARVILGREEPE